jgi:hypothetical protein
MKISVGSNISEVCKVLLEFKKVIGGKWQFNKVKT